MLAALLAILIAQPAPAGITSRTPAGKIQPGFNNWFQVSPDGYHYLLINVDKKGIELVLKDGKTEAKGRQSFSTTDKSHGISELKAVAGFSPNGRLAIVRAVLGADGSQAGQQVWLDGKGGHVYEQIGELAVSPKAPHIAYAAKDQAGWRLVFDATAGPPLRSAPHSLTFNPAGTEVAYLADSALHIGGKRIRFWAVASLIFSPDWKRVAWIDAADGGQTVGVDDLPLGRHSQVFTPGFSPDGRRFGYSALDTVDGRAKGFVFMEGKTYGPPMKSVAKEIAYSPQNAAYWFGQLDTDEHVLFKDGAAGDRWEFVTGAPCVAFSPSGAHSAYAAHRGGQKLLVVDGAPESGGPNVLFGNAGLVFDNEREFHYLDESSDGLELVCASVGKALAPAESTCHFKARQTYRVSEPRD